VLPITPHCQKRRATGDTVPAISPHSRLGWSTPGRLRMIRISSDFDSSHGLGWKMGGLPRLLRLPLSIERALPGNP